MLKRVDSASLYALNAVKNNTFKGEVITLDLKSDGVGYAGTNPAMSAAVKAECDKAAAAIKAGSLKVIPTYKDCKSIKNFPQNLGALD
jgi:basic membrane protein A